MLTITELTKRFGGFTALNAVSFSVREGEILGLIGPNGSGKTTLFNCVSGALIPTAGSIRFKDAEIAGLTPDRICHRGIARTFQIPRPFRKLTIVENVAVAAHYGAETRTGEAEARVKAAEILRLVGLPADPDAVPTLLGAGGLKKLDLARALATRPRVLLLDEWLSGLSPGELDGGMSVVWSLAAQGIAVILVEHVMTAVRALCSRVVVMNAGVKIAEGPPGEVLRDAEVIRAYLGDDDA